jgi:hypothetical protein
MSVQSLTMDQMKGDDRAAARWLMGLEQQGLIKVATGFLKR